jgi:hypothetical protein
MRKFILLASLIVWLCCCSQKPSLHDRLNGTWQSDLMTVTIDFNKGVYSGVAMGQTFSEGLKLLSENANLVTFLAGKDATIMVQMQQDGSIMLTKEGPEGGIPIILKRSPQ